LCRYFEVVSGSGGRLLHRRFCVFFVWTLIFTYCLYLCFFMFLFLIRDRVVTDVTAFVVIWFCKSERICGSFSLKGSLVSNMLDSYLDFNHVNSWFLAEFVLRFSNVPSLLRSVASMHLVYLLFDTVFLSVSVFVTGTWILFCVGG
jgi:hypothetical protein